ncbi:DegT/DnrJ/EryC1/StrS family aminotransferase [Chitinophaga solisilvae]|uniref:DegT/DnrJ/EryC1/StrS family aminotransferase n=1 Tax=Chitinophaga solisilvae TaxID=1233460 RepID=A0A3S1CV97_9BACT|nr:DegT/DnrJ/EryC1/StrS family aminotransferase [Chitinophaga solisilvae]NSL90149.1 DegT/DnrJ/EryC1/StrS family aminotransferase [Chitinophaga solisilvae]
MVPIQMVDLKRQYNKIKPQVDAAIQEVLESSAFINGGAVQKFSAELQQYLDIKHVIPCANGTDALQIAMMALGLQPGDEVITPSFTFIATAEVIAMLQLKPVFVDVDPQTYCLDVAAIEKAITPKTKAIVPVHLYGHVTDMEPLMALAARHNLYVIEDNAQAIGADYTFADGTTKKAGTIGHIGCTSFFPSKNLGCYGDGGAIFTNDDALAAQLRMVANHGQSARYYHDVVGCNSRLDTIQAAVLRIKLPLLDEYIKARRAVADAYDAAFAGMPQITTPFRAANSTHVFHQYTLQLHDADRNKLQQYLQEKNVPAMIYYPVPAHRQKMFADFGGAAFDLPVTDNLTTRVISLPIHTEMDNDQLDHIIQSVKSFLNNPPA